MQPAPPEPTAPATLGPEAALAHLAERIRRLVQLTQTLEAENRQLRQSLRTAQAETLQRDDELRALRAELGQLRSGAVSVLPTPPAELRAELDRLIAQIDGALAQLPKV